MWSPIKGTRRRVRREKGEKNGNSDHRPARLSWRPQEWGYSDDLVSLRHLPPSRRNFFNKARVCFAQPNILSPPLTTHTAGSRDIISMDCSEGEGHARRSMIQGRTLYHTSPSLTCTYPSDLLYILPGSYTPQCVHTSGFIPQTVYSSLYLRVHSLQSTSSPFLPRRDH